MDAQIIKADSPKEVQRAVSEAVRVLSAGGVVVFPTETVYGLGVRADLPAAMARLRGVKERDVQQGFTVHVAHRADASKFVPVMPPLGSRLLRKAWPGPLTILAEIENPEAAPIMAGLDIATVGALYYRGTVGLRCPDDPIAQSILAQAGGPVVASSANLPGKPAPRSGEEVLAALDGKFDLLIDSGRTKYSRASTIIKLTSAGYELVREGVLDAGIIERMSVLHILFVCTGNTCRSPMAAGLARKMIADRLRCDPSDLTARGVHITSAGISGGSGSATSGAVNAMAQRGIDLDNHSSSLLTLDTLKQADHVFVMTRAHQEAVLAMAPWAREKTQVLLGSKDVEDPVGMADSEYEECAKVIERGLKERLQEVEL